MLLSADIVDALVSIIVEVIVEAVRRERLQSQYPIIFPLFKASSVSLAVICLLSVVR